MDGRAWWATVHGVAKSRTWLNDFTHLTMDSLQMFTANSGASVEVCQRQFSWAKLKVNFWQFLHPAYFSLKSFPFSFPLSRSRRQWHPTPVRLPGKIPWMEEPSRLQSMGLLRVGHDWATSLSLFTFMHWRRKWWPTPVFLPGESQGWGSLVGCCLWGRTESDTTEAT